MTSSGIATEDSRPPSSSLDGDEVSQMDGSEGQLNCDPAECFLQSAHFTSGSKSSGNKYYDVNSGGDGDRCW